MSPEDKTKLKETVDSRGDNNDLMQQIEDAYEKTNINPDMNQDMNQDMDQDMIMNNGDSAATHTKSKYRGFDIIVIIVRSLMMCVILTIQTSNIISLSKRKDMSSNEKGSKIASIVLGFVLLVLYGLAFFALNRNIIMLAVIDFLSFAYITLNRRSILELKDPSKPLE